jgi:hypothetical protein
MTTPPFALNVLVEPSSSVTSTLPTGFETDMAYLLASATSAVVQLYALGITSLTPAMLSALPLAGGAQSYQQLATFTAPEAIGFGASTSTPGAFVQVTIGVAIQALDGSANPLFTVIALRGTQTYQEWINDLTAIPATYGLVSGVGTVHAGFYAVYTTGPDGQAPTNSNPRVTGSLADQVYQAVQTSAWPASVPLYITGHSLGAALAELCAMDLASNAASYAKSFTMLNFAPPQVAAGLLDDGQVFLYNPATFVAAYQAAVPNSYAVVNAADIVPILPPTLGSSTSFQVVFSPVVSTANTVMYCAQLGSIASNHDLATNYLPYVQYLASGFAAVEAARPVRSRASAAAVTAGPPA